MNDRNDTPASAAERMLKEMYPLVGAALDAIDGEFSEILINDIFNRVYGREEHLDIKTRELCTVAMLTATGRLHDLRTHIRVALNLDWETDEIREIILLCAIAGGWPAAFDGVRILDEYCKENNIDPPKAKELRKGYSDKDWIAEGIENGMALFGKKTFDNLISAFSPGGDDFKEFILTAVYGKLLARDHLDMRTKLLCLIAAFAALKSSVHLKAFIMGGLKNDVLPREIREVLLYSCIYAGQEAAFAAMQIFGECTDKPGD
jgi:4-carboxymuconolactone decarboxylase